MGLGSGQLGTTIPNGRHPASVRIALSSNQFFFVSVTDDLGILLFALANRYVCVRQLIKTSAQVPRAQMIEFLNIFCGKDFRQLPASSSTNLTYLPTYSLIPCGLASTKIVSKTSRRTVLNRLSIGIA